MTPYGSPPLVATWGGVLDHLGGGHEANRPCRRVARTLIGLLPDAPMLALDAEWFIRGAVTTLVKEHGIRQIVHADAGYPRDRGHNTHQIAHSLAPNCRTLYADADVFAFHAARCFRAESEQEAVVHAGLADGISGILEHPAAAALLDAALPTAVLCPAAEAVPDHVLARLLDDLARLLPAGGYLALGQLSTDDPALAARIDTAMAQGLDGNWGRLRTLDQLAGVLGDALTGSPEPVKAPKHEHSTTYRPAGPPRGALLGTITRIAAASPEPGRRAPTALPPGPGEPSGTTAS
ncbi:SAM-dependent methyltransferase [Kitasatospora sp. NPDC088783]|uniref:SAM-dependent methyltransferase n=1 Tax=Kitasatospora sp. NPDC088783 TaxID=3364077 RepID=UPI003821E978